MRSTASAVVVALAFAGALTACQPPERGQRVGDAIVVYSGDHLGIPKLIKVTPHHILVAEARGYDGWLKVFTRAGDFVGGFGKTGPGPSELESAWELLVQDDSTALVYDLNQNQITVFRIPTGAVLREWTATHSAVLGSRTFTRMARWDSALVGTGLWMNPNVWGIWRDGGEWVWSDSVTTAPVPSNAFFNADGLVGTSGDVFIKTSLRTPAVELWDLRSKALIYRGSRAEEGGHIGAAGNGEQIFVLRTELLGQYGAVVDQYDQGGAFVRELPAPDGTIHLDVYGDTLFLLVHEPWPGILKVALPDVRAGVYGR